MKNFEITEVNDIKSPICYQCINDCVVSSKGIIKVIAEANIEEIVGYTNSI